MVLIDPDRDTWVVRTAGPPLALADAELGLSPTGGSAKQKLKQAAAAKALRWPELLLAVAFDDKAVRALRESPIGKELIQACHDVFQPVPA